MPINTEGLRTTLKQKIKEALDAPISNESDSEKVKQDFADSIANAVADGVDAWIKTATVTVQPGIPVTTSTGAGKTTGPGTGTIS
jgi:hypothetical protein